MHRIYLLYEVRGKTRLLEILIYRDTLNNYKGLMNNMSMNPQNTNIPTKTEPNGTSKKDILVFCLLIAICAFGFFLFLSILIKESVL